MCNIISLLNHWVRELVESILHSPKKKKKKTKKKLLWLWVGAVSESSSAIPKAWVLFFLMIMTKRKKIIKDFMLTYIKRKETRK